MHPPNHIFMVLSAIVVFIIVLATMFSLRKSLETSTVQKILKKEERELSDLFFKYAMMAIVGTALLAAAGFASFGILFAFPHSTWLLAVVDVAGYVSMYSIMIMLAISASFGPSNDPLMFSGIEKRCNCKCHRPHNSSEFGLM